MNGFPDPDERVGYVLKRTAAALRSAMDTALRGCDLTVPQYACLEMLDRRPGLSNAELARGAFVTRQSMNVVLRNAQRAGLVERPEDERDGRVMPARLTGAGREVLARARADVAVIERRMVGDLPPERVDALLADLRAMAAALEAGS